MLKYFVFLQFILYAFGHGGLFLKAEIPTLQREIDGK